MDGRIGTRRGRGLLLAATGDLHAHDGSPRCDALHEALVDAGRAADLVLLAGDLTLHGTARQADLLAGICVRFDVPVIAVLGNHDERRDGSGAVAGALRAAGITVLEGNAIELEVGGLRVGLAGAMGAFGGFEGVTIEGISEQRRRAISRRAALQAAALHDGLQAIAGCDVRIALMHYSPTTDTLRGEPRAIWGYLGSELLAEPIRRHRPDAVVHAHAHSGSFRGSIGSVPVYNVSAEVLRGRVGMLELPAAADREVE